MDLELVGLVLVDWGNWRDNWGIDWRLALEVSRRGELVRLLLCFWLLHARLKYTSLRNYGPTIGMVHERRKEYRLSYTIVKVEGGQRSGVWIIRTVQLKWNNTLRAGATMGTNPRGSQSSDGVTDRTKGKWNKGGSGGVEQGTKHEEADRK